MGVHILRLEKCVTKSFTEHSGGEKSGGEYPADSIGVLLTMPGGKKRGRLIMVPTSAITKSK